jgi:NAD(P)H-hydrate epimerase
MKIVSAEQMRNIDRRATERFGIPSIVLMENAALAVVDALFEHYPDCERAAIFCGIGQNGGDGLAIARHLENRGVVPIVVIVGDRSRFKGDALTNLIICERLSIPIYDIRDSEHVEDALAHAADGDVVVDAIFGTGLNRAPAGLHADVIRAIAELRLPVIAVDVPSGANASSAEPFDPILQAEVTVTFAAPKLCHIFEPSSTYCGEVVVADIAIPDIAIGEELVTLSLITPRDLHPLFPPRLSATHKGTYGHVGIIAGSPGRSGAALMVARGAHRTGAGLVSVMTDRDTALLIHSGSAESMTYSGDDLATFLDNKSAAVVGPGLADDERAYARTRDVVGAIDVPLVVDASGLNAFAGQPGAINPDHQPRIITPHAGELARLLGTTVTDRMEAVREAARVCNCVVLLKGHQTLVADPSGQISVNPTGNPGMASGGMGDVLAGIAGALLARNMDPFDAACAAAYIHGLAGDMLKDEHGDTGMTAMDLADRIPLAIQRLRAS